MENENDLRKNLKADTWPPETVAENDISKNERKLRDALSEREKKFSKEEIEDFTNLLNDLNKEGGLSVADLQEKEGLVKKIIMDYLNSVESTLNLTNENTNGAFRKTETGEISYHLGITKNDRLASEFTVTNLEFVKRCLSTAISAKEKAELKDVSLQNKDDKSAETQVNVYVPQPERKDPTAVHHTYATMDKLAQNINGNYSYGHKTLNGPTRSQSEGR